LELKAHLNHIKQPQVVLLALYLKVPHLCHLEDLNNNLIFLMVPTLPKVHTHLGNKLPPASNHIGALALIHLVDITMGIIISTTTITNIITTSIITTIKIHMVNKQLNIHLGVIMHINIQQGPLLFLLKLKLSLKNKNKFPLQIKFQKMFQRNKTLMRNLLY
jgi:hypothetical protein